MNKDDPKQARQVLAFVRRYPTKQWWRQAKDHKQLALECVARLQEHPERDETYIYGPYRPSATYPPSWNVDDQPAKALANSIVNRYRDAVESGKLPNPPSEENGGPSQTPTTPRTGPGTSTL